MTAYADSLTILALLLLMVFLQSMIATVAHRKQNRMIPGIVDEKLDHHSFVFRSHRTFHNSLENVPLFIFTALVAINLGVEASALYWTSLVFFVARAIHMVLFYKIATNKNPSPRSYFYVIGLLAQIYLFWLVFSGLL